MADAVAPRVEVKSKGDEQCAKLLSGMADRGADPRPAFKRIMDDLRVAEDRWFASEGGGAWAPLADVTREEKARRGYPSNTLVRTGFLGASLTVRSGSRSIRKTTKDQMRFGTGVFYAKFHGMGSGVPVRAPLVPLDAPTRKRMVSDVKNYLVKSEMR